MFFVLKRCWQGSAALEDDSSSTEPFVRAKQRVDRKINGSSAHSQLAETSPRLAAQSYRAHRSHVLASQEPRKRHVRNDSFRHADQPQQLARVLVVADLLNCDHNPNPHRTLILEIVAHDVI